MGGQDKPPAGPDLAAGIAASGLGDGEMLAGHVGDDAVLLARHEGRVFAVGATCTHYGGPLAEGLLVDGTVRCPWHHACFSLRTGGVERPPARDDLPRWRVEEHGGTIYVREKLDTAAPPSVAAGGTPPESVLILGAGAAGECAAEMLRREGYRGAITLVDPDPDAACDRPNLSKDYLAGTAPEEWIPLRPPSFFAEHAVELVLGSRATAIVPEERRVVLEDGSTRSYGALLIATGAEPVRLPREVDPDGRALYLRTLADSRAIVSAAGGARRAVVLGASFIGLEVAASLRARGLEVHVVAPDALPLERILGPELGAFVRDLHQQHGVVFHLPHKVQEITARGVVLDDGTALDADLVVAGIGVRPRTELAEQAGLATDRGILVDRFLRTSVPGIFAAGDVARWPDPLSGEKVRIEHWVVAQRQGQAAARNILGQGAPFEAVPFFWSRHYDASIAYVGHAARWEAIEVAGSLAGQDARVTYLGKDRVMLATATLSRDRESLQAEAAMEERIRAAS